MKTDEPGILELLMRHELAIKGFYEAFAFLFVERKTLWESLAKDEQRHADWLGSLRSGSAADG